LIQLLQSYKQQFTAMQELLQLSFPGWSDWRTDIYPAKKSRPVPFLHAVQRRGS